MNPINPSPNFKNQNTNHKFALANKNGKCFSESQSTSVDLIDFHCLHKKNSLKYLVFHRKMKVMQLGSIIKLKLMTLINQKKMVISINCCVCIWWNKLWAAWKEKNYWKIFIENNVQFSCKHINQKRNIQTLSHFSLPFPIVLRGNTLPIKKYDCRFAK